MSLRIHVDDSLDEENPRTERKLKVANQNIDDPFNQSQPCTGVALSGCKQSPFCAAWVEAETSVWKLTLLDHSVSCYQFSSTFADYRSLWLKTEYRNHQYENPSSKTRFFFFNFIFSFLSVKRTLIMTTMQPRSSELQSYRSSNLGGNWRE